MRNLTVLRNKSFVACLGTMKVYIEDHEASELTIDSVPCRKLGTLKNGEQKTFEISEDAARIYVIADKFSKGYCSECYDLAPGTEDVFLSGQNSYNPLQGNPFRFNGVVGEETLRHRKKGMKRGIIILLVCFAIGLVIGFGGALLFDDAPRTFSESGMQITLTNDFTRFDDYEGFDACFGSYDVAVFASKDPFSYAFALSVMTVSEYADYTRESSAVSASTVREKDGLTYFVYTAYSDDGTLYRYFAFFYKTSDAFWTVQFAVEDALVGTYTDSIFEWAASVEFS